MKKIFVQLIISVAVFAFTGCSDDDNNDSALTILRADIEFGANGGNGTISFSTIDENVTVTSDKEWLKPDNPAGYTVAFTVEANNEISGRTAQVTLTSGRGSETVSINQLGTILATDEEYEVSGVSKTTAFDLYVNTDKVTVKVADNCNWVDVQVEKGKLLITPELNTGAERSTTLTISAGWKTTTAILRQRSFVSVSHLQFGTEGTVSTFSLSKDIYELSKSWSINPADSWLHVEENGLDITVTADANTTGAQRHSSITITADEATFTLSARQSSVQDYYTYFLGQWILRFDDGQTQVVTLEENEYNQSYTMTGLELDIVIAYDNVTKQMSMLSQALGVLWGYELWLCPWALDSEGMFTNNASAGFNMIFNHDEDNNVISLSDNGAWKRYRADGFIFCFIISASQVESIAQYPYIECLYR